MSNPQRVNPDDIPVGRGSVAHWYEQHRKSMMPVAFGCGFLWDSLTLTRIDRLLDNLVLFGYLLAAGVLILLMGFLKSESPARSFIHRYSGSYPLVIQFLLGGLLSAYIVYYFRSAWWNKGVLFIVILLLLLVANEGLSQHLMNLPWLLGLYFVVSSSFFVFMLPVVIKVMNVLTFFAGGLLGLLAAGSLAWLLYRRGAFPSRRQVHAASALLVTLFLGLNVLYLGNWIPPIPLSLQFSGVYHEVKRVGESYELKFHKHPWYQFWKKSDKRFRKANGNTVVCYAEVFAPTELSKQIYHRWQRYHPEFEEWRTTDRIGYAVEGGRDGGYRGFTVKRHVSPGAWRVRIEIEEGLVLGTVPFTVEVSDKPVREWSTIVR